MNKLISSVKENKKIGLDFWVQEYRAQENKTFKVE